MVKVRIRPENFRKERGDFLLCEIDSSFSPGQFTQIGSGEVVWRDAGRAKMAESKPKTPLSDFEIVKTGDAGNFKELYTKGILHLVLPSLKSADRKELLKKCYESILNKAIAEKAKIIVMPFIGILSVHCPKEEGVEIAMRTIYEFFISGGNTGDIEEIVFCCTKRSAYQLAVKHYLYLKYLKPGITRGTVQPQSNSIDNGGNVRNEEDVCVFSSVDLSFESARAFHLQCSGDLQKLCELPDRELLYECENVVDLMLLRGGIHCRRIMGMSVCSTHIQRLLTWWGSNKMPGNMKNRDGKVICSLPEIHHDGGIRPVINRRLNKSDTLKIINATGQFVHVGTALCFLHAEVIRQQNFESLLFSNDDAVMQEPTHDDFMSLGDLQQSLSEIGSSIPNASNESFDHQFPDSSVTDKSMDSVIANIPPPPEAYRDNNESQRHQAVRNIAALFGVDRLTGSRSQPWKTLRPETKRKKINGMICLHNELYKACAGEFWEEMRDACQRKMKIVEKDVRVEAVVDMVGQCLEDSNEKTVRIGVLKLLTGIFTEKEIRDGTGASRYLIRLAKLSSFEELRTLNSSFHRERYNKMKILITLPHSSKKIVVGSGSEVTIAAVARIYSYREIHKLFIRYCEDLAKQKGLVTPSDVAEFARVHALGYSTAYKLMEVLSPNRQLRMSCIDSYQADCFDAFDEFSFIVDELALMDEISLEKTMELRRRIRVAKNFMFGELRSHICKESDVLSHCWTHALADRSNPRFDSPCTHSHDKSCTECTEAMSLSSIMENIVRIPYGVAFKNKSDRRFRLGRMLEIISDSEGLIKEYRKHVIRCVASEYDRRKTIESLEEGHALIVADYAMKILPTDAMLKQSQWYAKAGISFHMGATVAKIKGELVSHEFGHVSSISKQDSAAVAGILEHTFGILKENGVTHIHIRSDNAATYHSVGLIAYLLYLTNKLNITVLSHIFSEPQFGKGRADRAISLVKGKLNSYIDSGKSACTADEIVTGFTHNILLKGNSFYIIEVTRLNKGDAALNDIKKYSSFWFERNKGVRVRKHNAIGEGMLVKEENLHPMDIKSKIHRSAGYLSNSVRFWKPIGTAKEADIDEVNEIESVKEEESGTKDYLRCPDMLCQSKFKTERGLDRHVLLGDHKRYKGTQTVVHYGVLEFSKLLETTEEAQMAVQCDSIVPLGSGFDSEESKPGWALRTFEIRRIKPEVKKEVERLIVGQLDEDRRAEAKEIRDQIRDLKNMDGSYRFEIVICLTESQIKSQITRILNERKKKKENMEGNQKNVTVEPKKGGRKRKEPRSSEKSETRKSGRPPKKSREDVSEESEQEKTDDEEEEGLEEQIEEEIDYLELMNQLVDKNRHEIFEPEDFEEEL